MDQLFDVIEAAELDCPDDFVSAAFAFLATALAKLPAAKREDELLAIELGTLRRAVQLFGPRRQSVPDGARWLQ